MAKKEPKVFLIEGQPIFFHQVYLDGHHVDTLCLRGKVEAPFTKTWEKTPTWTYYPLVEILKDIRYQFNMYWRKPDVAKNITFVYWLTKEPKTLEECQTELAKTSLGFPIADWYHSYSDLTGYLWTNFSIKASGHDVYQEIYNTILRTKKQLYLTLEIKQH